MATQYRPICNLVNNESRHTVDEEKRELRHNKGVLNSRTCNTLLILATLGDPNCHIKKLNFAGKWNAYGDK